MRPALLLLLLGLTFRAEALFRDPAVSRTHVAFVHGGQLWTVPRGGGRATRITNTPGNKFEVRFSPDGRRLAFGASETRNAVDLYTIDVRGGAASRVTFLPSHQVLSQWTDDDRLLFHSNALSFSRIEMQLWSVPSRGGLPRKLPPAYGADGAIDASGTLLAYTPQWPNPLIAHWKRYRGGAAPDLSIVDLRGGASQRITDWEGWDATPMWRGAILYYVSDAGAEARRNVWAYDTRTKTRRQLTHFRDFDVLEASIGGDAIVFRRGAAIQLLDLRTERASSVRIVLPAPDALQRDVDASAFITNRQLANGRVLYEARGDLWLADAGSAARNLTKTSGVFEREAALSPDGKRVAYFADAQLYVRDVDAAQAVQWTKFGAGFRYRPVWSPDGRRLAFADQRGAIFICDVATQEVREIDREPWAELPELAWSADSSWLAYTRTGTNRLGALWRYDAASGERVQITADTFNASTPVFAPNGTQLFFISYRNFGTPATDWLSQRFLHRQLGVIMTVPLANLRFTIEDVERRAVRLATTGGAITALGATASGDVVFGLTDGNGARSVRIYRVANKSEEVLLANDSDFTLGADGAQIMLARVVRDLASGVETTLDTTMPMHIDLRAEWQELFHDAWRNYRDFFFAPKRGAIDWDALRAQYEPLLAHCVTREEVNAVLEEFIGESSVGHAYIGSPGDVSRASGPATGMLGADFELDRGAFRIAHIVQAASWDETVRSPLAEVHEGEYLLAVNGKPLDVSIDPRAAFVGLAEQQVTITVSPHPTIDADARDIIVTTLASENPLRYREWIEQNRIYVDRRSDGRIGYLHIPDFSTNALGDFARQFHGQIAKEALIIDARWSQGGWTGQMLAEALARRPLNSAAARETTNTWPTPRWGARPHHRHPHLGRPHRRPQPRPHERIEN